MIERDESPAAPGDSAGQLADLAMQITERLQAGDPVDAEDFGRRHPACAGPIRRLLPTISELVAYGRSVGGRRGPSPTQEEPDHET